MIYVTGYSKDHGCDFRSLKPAICVQEHLMFILICVFLYIIRVYMYVLKNLYNYLYQVSSSYITSSVA